MFGPNFLRTESHRSLEEQNDGPRATLHKANLTLTSKLGMERDWGSDGNLVDMNVDTIVQRRSIAVGEEHCT